MSRIAARGPCRSKLVPQHSTGLLVGGSGKGQPMAGASKGQPMAGARVGREGSMQKGSGKALTAAERRATPCVLANRAGCGEARKHSQPRGLSRHQKAVPCSGHCCARGRAHAAIGTWNDVMGSMGQQPAALYSLMQLFAPTMLEYLPDWQAAKQSAHAHSSRGALA